MRILYVDPFQQFPAGAIALESSGRGQAEYVTNLRFQQVGPHQLATGRELRRSYGIAASDMESDLGRHFDLGLLVFPAAVLLNRGDPFLADNQHAFRLALGVLDRWLVKGAPRGLVDSDDYPHDPLEDELVRAAGFSAILKREMRKDRSYGADVRPFPLVVGGRPDRIALLLRHPRSSGMTLSRRTLWAGNAFTHVDAAMGVHVDRADMLRQIRAQDTGRSLRVLPRRVPYRTYLGLLRSHGAFLDLNGVGNLTNRFFEGVSLGRVPVTQQWNVILPDSMLFLEETLRPLSFHSPQGAARLCDTLRSRNSMDKAMEAVQAAQSKLTADLISSEMLRSL